MVYKNQNQGLKTVVVYIVRGYVFLFFTTERIILNIIIISVAKARQENEVWRIMKVQ